MDWIAHNRPWLTEKDRAAVLNVLESGQIGGGAMRNRVELKLAQLFLGGAAALVSSGTAALYLALRALNLPPGALVAVPSYSCVALLEAVHLAGLRAHPVDVCPASFVMDVSLLADLPPGQRPQAVIAVHQHGERADIGGMAAQVPFVIEDASQSFGTRFGPGLAHPASAAVAVSFYATKVVTSGQGGAVWCRNTQRVLHLRQMAGFANNRDGGTDFNFQLSDVAAALLDVQLARLDTIRSQRFAIAASYAAACPMHLRHLWDPDDAGRLWYRFLVMTKDAAQQERMIHHFARAGVEASALLRKNQLLHRILGLDPRGYPNAERHTEQVVSLPLYPALEAAAVQRVAEVLAAFSG